MIMWCWRFFIFIIKAIAFFINLQGASVTAGPRAAAALTPGSKVSWPLHHYCSSSAAACTRGAGSFLNIDKCHVEVIATVFPLENTVNDEEVYKQTRRRGVAILRRYPSACRNSVADRQVSVLRIDI